MGCLYGQQQWLLTSDVGPGAVTTLAGLPTNEPPYTYRPPSCGTPEAADENWGGLTLLVAAGNRRYAVLVTDRRYTVNGRLLDVADDDRHKLVIARSRGFRMAVAFTGLARTGRFETAHWLANALRDALNPDGGFAMEAFAGQVTRDIEAW
jgi:hypothetical protein